MQGKRKTMQPVLPKNMKTTEIHFVSFVYRIQEIQLSCHVDTCVCAVNVLKVCERKVTNVPFAEVLCNRCYILKWKVKIEFKGKKNNFVQLFGSPYWYTEGRETKKQSYIEKKNHNKKKQQSFFFFFCYLFHLFSILKHCICKIIVSCIVIPTA